MIGAIAGIFRRDGAPVEARLVSRMIGRLVFRGPAGNGIWCNSVAGMGSCAGRNSVSEGLSAKPSVRPEWGLAIAADVRLDNRDDLLVSLGEFNSRGTTATDAELILAAYRKWGERCPHRLAGDFAFVIWDGKRRRLFCARDVVGVRPFYYHLSTRAVYFGSEMKALLCCPEVPRRLNEGMVAAYLAKFFEDKESTFYRDIQRLPPAHAMSIGDSEFRCWCYWKLATREPVHLAGDGEYAEAFLDVFTRAVRRRVGDDEKIGCMLSGGLDSSSITCTARDLLAEQGGPPIETFSAVFPSAAGIDGRIDEKAYIRAVLATGAFRPHTVFADRTGPLSGVLWHEDEPLPAPSLYMDCAVFSAAAAAGVGVLLSGNDGDTTVSYGYEFLTQLARSGHWLRLTRESRALASRFDSDQWKRVAWELGFKPLVPGPAIELWRRLRGRSQPPWGLQSIISPAFARRTKLDQRVRQFHRRTRRRARTATEEHRNALESGLMLWVVEVLDKASAAHGLELRFPFFDQELMQFCVSLPPEQKLQNGLNRAVMRRAMGGILPPEVRHRVKKGSMSVNFKTKLAEHDRPMLDRLVREDLPLLCDFVDTTRLRRDYERFLAEPLRAEQPALNLFLAANLAVWLRRSGLRG